MPNMSNQELVRAFNINLRFNGIAVTNLTVQNLHGKDHIVILFDKNMDSKQYMKYLSDLKEKIVKASYKTKKVAGMPYNLQSFPFTFHKERLDKGRKRFSVVIDEGVVFNLKCYLAKALARDIKEKMGSEFGVKYARERVYDVDFDRNSYLYSMYFDDQRLQKYFIDSFSADIGGYENAPSGYLEVRGNYVHIKKSIFDDVEFIKDIAAYNASLECRYLQTPSTKNKAVDKLKHTVIDFMDRTADVPVRTIIRTSHNGSNENSVLIPLVNQIKKDSRLLDNNDAYKINSAFNMEILSDVSESISVRLPKSDSSDSIIYGIDFADVDIAYCVLNKIIESSVINKDHELAIDPERVLSPAQSSCNSPTRAEPSGLATPPKQRKKDTDSGYDGNSPPRPKDSVAHSPSGGPRSLVEELQVQGFPTRGHGEELRGSPRRGFIELSDGLLFSRQREFPPSTQVSYPAVSDGVAGPSSLSQSVDATQNVQAGTSQPMNPWSSPASSAEPSLWQPSRPSPWKGANPVGANPWVQRTNRLSSPAPSLWSLSQSGPSSSRGAGEGMLTGASIVNPYFSPSSSLRVITPPVHYGIPRRPILLIKKEEHDKSEQGACSQVGVRGPSSWKGASERRTSDKPLTEKEKELIEALLYWFNLNNYTFEYTHTNFIVENGKIASFIDNGVNVKEYLQELRDSTIKDYCVTEEEAYDLNEFPFKFLSNCEKNQETTVVANISSGALSNLKKLFIHEHEKEVKMGDIDIDIVEEGVKSKRSLWVNSEVKSGKSLKVVMPTCYPKESKLKGIPIVKGGSGYSLLHNYPTKEKKPRDTTTTFKAIKESKKDDSSSGYSSGFVTDAENVSSKAEATTSSGYESMDCENTGGGLSKRKSLEPLAGSSTTKKTRSESDSSSFEGKVGSPHPGLSDPTFEQVCKQLNETRISKW